MDDQGREYVQLIKGHIHSVTDSFCRSLETPALGLSPKELLVADLVRKGKSSADIAKLLDLSVRTVEAYRNSIRNKLKITGKSINMNVYLNKRFSN